MICANIQSTQEHHTPSTNRTRGPKYLKTTMGTMQVQETWHALLQKIVGCTNAYLEKLINGLYINHKTKLRKKLVDKLSNMDGLDEEDVIMAAASMIYDH